MLLASFTVVFNISIATVMVTYLIEDAYGVPEDRVAGVSGNLGVVSEIGGMVAELSLGYLQDLLGRKWISIGSLLVASVTVFCMTLPNTIWALYFLKTISNAAFIPISYTPFTLDYVD